MGLDQWLCKRPLGSEEEKRIYWRKSNQIHGWFDRQCGEVMNCKVYDISYAQLKELKDTCQKVLDNHDLASELLPVTRGCFFGSYSYDDSYFYDLEYTVKSLNELLDESDESDEFYYHAWW